MATPMVTVEPTAAAGTAPDPVVQELVFQLRDVGVSYSGTPAVVGVSLAVHRFGIAALIGPSGCGKSTLLRSFNRMNDFIPGAEMSGELLYHGRNVYAEGVDPVEVRRRI